MSRQNHYRDRDKDKPNERQMKAEKYLKEYDIQNIITEMINYLLHKKTKKPIIEMIKYLGGLLTDEEKKSENLSIPPLDSDYHPLIDFPKYDKNCNSLLKEFLDMDTFIKLRDKISKYGTNLGFITRVNEVYPKNNIGLMVGDADCLKKFEILYKNIICKAHNLDKDKLEYFTENNFNLKNLVFNDIKKINLDEIKGLKKIVLSISRNIYNEPFVSFYNVENRTENIQRRLDSELIKIKYYKDLIGVNDNKIKMNDIIKNINYDMDFFNAVNPKDNLIQKQRKIYKNGNDTILVLINFCDNFQLIKSIIIDKNIKKPLNDIFIENFNEFNDAIRSLQYYFGFEFDHNFGYLTSNISLFGTGFRIQTEINLDDINKGDIKLEEIINKIEFDKYSENIDINSNGNILIFSSSPKISTKSFNEFLIQYFEKILKIIEIKNE
jgi:hypothetical protein